MIAIKEMKMPNSCSECNLTTRKLGIMYVQSI